MMPVNPLLLTLAFFVDLIIGDPPNLPHPVILLGKAIAYLDKKLNTGSPKAKQIKGVLLVVLVVIGSFIVTNLFLYLLGLIAGWLRFIAEVYLISTTLAGKSLLDAGRQVLVPLEKGNLQDACNNLAMFVSRDTKELSENDIARGVIETLSENFVDGFLSPLIFVLLGGAPLGMAFKAVSTLDSMVGYKNDAYKDFGWFSAKTDDWANYLSARISVIILIIAGFVKKMPIKYAYYIWQRDAKKHPSPNGGNPESIVAGLLGVRLGGKNIYHGKVHYRAEMGEFLNPLTPTVVLQCIQLIHLAIWISFVFGITLAAFIFL